MQQELIIKTKLMQLAQLGHFDQAELLAKQLLTINQGDLEVWYALAQILKAQGRFDEAIDAYRQSVTKSSGHFLKALDQLIELYIQKSDFEQGLKFAEKRVKKEPKNAKALYQKGFCQIRLLQPIDALETLTRAHHLLPQDKAIHILYADLLAASGNGDLAVKEYDKGALFKIDLAKYSRYLEFQNYCTDFPEEEIYKRFKTFGEFIEKNNDEYRYHVTDRTNRKLKVGYLSPDFRDHSVAFFMKPIFQAHNRDEFEIFAYSDTNVVCETQAFFKTSSDVWRDSSLMNDDTLLETIREDGIDILVDLASYTAKQCRVNVLAKRAAPIQINYLGFPNTSGLSRIDYRIVDDITDPEGLSEAYHTETLIRIKPSFLCFSQQDKTLEVASLPAIENGFVTFGSFNNGQKISDAQLTLWGKLLANVPQAKLIIKNATFVDESTKKAFRKKVKKHGLDTKRLILLGFTPDLNSHLCIYNKVDIHLDTYPYSGTTTTLQAIWMGVPTITKQGEAHRSRVSASILKSLDLDEMVVTSDEEYLNKAKELASDIAKLQSIRCGLRSRLESSELMNAELFTRQLEAFYKRALTAYPKKIDRL